MIPRAGARAPFQLIFFSGIKELYFISFADHSVFDLKVSDNATEGVEYRRKFEGYGKLSHKNLDDLRSGGRSLLVTGEDEKEDPISSQHYLLQLLVVLFLVSIHLSHLKQVQN